MWRYGIYDKYKQNRKFSKVKYHMKLATDYIKSEEFKSKMAEYFKKKEIATSINFKVEADDLIYLAIKKYQARYKHFHVISKDGDLTQLKLYFDNVRIYDTEGKELTKVNNLAYMVEKIVIGDSGDNILHIGTKSTYTKLFLDWLLTG